MDTFTDYFGTDLTPGMSIRLDGLDWNIEHVFPYAEVVPADIGSDVGVRVVRDVTKSILHLGTFIRHQGQHHMAYVIDNSDTFQTID